MSKLALRATRLTVYQWLIAQACVIVVVSLLSFLFQGLSSILATLLGGLICFVPQALLVRWLFAYYRVSKSRQIVKKFFIGEMLKLFITGLLFLLALIKWPAQAPELLLGFISAQIAFWFAPYLANIMRIRVK